eukprot:CAMPEP_0171250094 /NCGR_PEP_ID=MMETSP0790-20130122/49916_1 /TAXON_ID=2925 /ORGANISM="Alexandrium catenella, Strain OF101" /LENGTH=49 /DNA_ID= /DNA_START= /DNA_END= /DNA_ORIENTATION=
MAALVAWSCFMLACARGGNAAACTATMSPVQWPRLFRNPADPKPTMYPN